MLWNLCNTSKLGTPPTPSIWHLHFQVLPRGDEIPHPTSHHQCLIPGLNLSTVLAHLTTCGFPFSRLLNVVGVVLFCFVVNRHSVKKEILRKTEFLLLRSLLFSQFWKLDIKQVSKSQTIANMFICIKNVHCLTSCYSGNPSYGHSVITATLILQPLYSGANKSSVSHLIRSRLPH